MKILAIDDQQLILLSVKKKLTEAGYVVETASSAEEGIRLYDSFQPNLVLLDMNMPQPSGAAYASCKGIEVVKYIRVFRNQQTPILVLSGNTNEEVILKGFDLGINDYMKKPVGLDEMVARIKRTIGSPQVSESPVQKQESQMVGKHCVGVVIPCYNEADRLMGEEFQNFAFKNLGYHLCFVNDGSTDNTLEVLEGIRKGNEESISVYNCEKNGGKAEAVRQGMLHLAKDAQFDYIGYLDADLSTDFRDFDALVQTLENSDFKIVSGSRISRMGADITKESARKIISKTINLVIQRILGMPFKDTQCGAKVMHRDLVVKMFTNPFVTKWLFDVEIFLRMRKAFGKEEAIAAICEQPLQRWIHADGSKLSYKDSIKIMLQLSVLSWKY
ncbi:Glycosyl transferase family 2 [Robiginitalea myxolifaciens]|uniref:dolichyl-phosphate beta-glucosyltransferase n=1 Tax=Robiginitalea myxolifaciens TaxID=400055 RepID=A0A1I6FN42_9FLAO|nr:response regulator [Robiginitalea myxolifaciens]SFR31351.1 Glycosyl transferase family 2 [Robiginitalea myxolifaciens]